VSERAALARAALAGLLLAATGCKRTETDAGGAPSAEPPRAVSSGPALASGVALAPSASAAAKDCCMGKNPCRGKGGCAVPESHACKGKNACAGQGGCRAHCPR
jgi:hypothetical protein